MVLDSKLPITTGAENPLVEPRPPRRRPILKWTGLIVAVLLVLFYAGGGWYFAGQIRTDALDPQAPGEYTFDIEVLSVATGTVALDATADDEHLSSKGIRGIAWDGGYGTVGDALSIASESVTRSFSPISGTLQAGMLVDLDGFASWGDPQTALGLTFEAVAYTSPLGPMEAWHVPASGDTWIILVHGKSAPLREFNRILPALNAAGIHALVINYRNDVGVPEDESGLYRYGLTEWQDVEAAVQYAFDHGASDVTAGGYSMGGAIVMSFLRESPLAADVSAVVLDAPMLDFGVTVDHQASNRSLPLIGLPIPQSLTSVAKIFSDWRFGVDWDRLDYLDQADDYATPILIFHGTEDDDVPIGPSRDLAELRPDLVELVETEGAGHVLSWNVNPAGYEQRFVDFLVANFT